MGACAAIELSIRIGISHLNATPSKAPMVCTGLSGVGRVQGSRRADLEIITGFPARAGVYLEGPWETDAMQGILSALKKRGGTAGVLAMRIGGKGMESAPGRLSAVLLMLLLRPVYCAVFRTVLAPGHSMEYTAVLHDGRGVVYTSCTRVASEAAPKPGGLASLFPAPNTVLSRDRVSGC